MRNAFRAGVVAMAAAMVSTSGVLAADPAAKAAAEPPQVELNLKVAEFDETDRTEIDRTLGISKGFAGLDVKAVRSLEEKKLLREVASPTIYTVSGRMASYTVSGRTSSIRYEQGKGRDRKGKSQPVTHEISVMPQVEPGIEPTIRAEIRCRETVGTGAGRQMTEIDTGAKLKPGETFAIHFNLRPSAASANAPAAGVGKLLLVTATIVEPKPKGEVYANPQVGNQGFAAQAAVTLTPLTRARAPDPNRRASPRTLRARRSAGSARR